MEMKALVLATILACGAQAGWAAQTIATVSVNASQAGRMIPKDYEGFSIQFDPSAENYFRGPESSPAYVLGGASAPNLVVYRLIENLGEGTLRTNSGLASEPCWNASAAPFPEACPWPVTEDMVKGYARASAATGWGVIVEINLAQNDAAWAIQFGKAFVRAFRAAPGSRLTGFEIGNEPDLYGHEILFGRTPIRSRDYSWRDLVSDWQPYIKTFKSDPETKDVPLIGPAYDQGGWTTPYLGSFIDGVGAKNLGFATVHVYPTSDCDGASTSIRKLLSNSGDHAYLDKARGWVQAAHERGLNLVLGETNSTSCEGQKGVDDVFASTAWGLDWLFLNAEAGMRSLYFHTNNSYYSPVFVTTYRSPDDGELKYADFVAPLYYAMYAFSRYAEGQRLLTTTIKTGANIKAYAVGGGSNGPITVFLINKDLHAAGRVAIIPSRRMGRARLLAIRAPSLASKAVSFGGTSFSNQTGQLSAMPETSQIEPGPDGGYMVRLPNASIAVVKIEP